MVIEKAVISDAADLATLAVQVWLDTYATEGIRQAFSDYIWTGLTPEKFAEKLTDADNEIYKLTESGHLTGFISICFNSVCPSDHDIRCEIDKLYIHENFTGRGAGAEMIRFLEGVCRVKNIPAVWLSVYEGNSRARGFYKKMDFREAGEFFFELGNERHRNMILIKKIY
ncbi:MAG: GNAT family N-acetyltransferase [Bacteroidota bacterium]